eukprot:7816-Heterococcus_DN1.PRE.1
MKEQLADAAGITQKQRLCTVPHTNSLVHTHTMCVVMYSISQCYENVYVICKWARANATAVLAAAALPLLAMLLLQISVWFLNYRQRNKEKLRSNLKKAAPRKQPKNNRSYESD